MTLARKLLLLLYWLKRLNVVINFIFMLLQHRTVPSIFVLVFTSETFKIKLQIIWHYANVFLVTNTITLHTLILADIKDQTEHGNRKITCI